MYKQADLEKVNKQVELSLSTAAQLPVDNAEKPR